MDRTPVKAPKGATESTGRKKQGGPRKEDGYNESYGAAQYAKPKEWHVGEQEEPARADGYKVWDRKQSPEYLSKPGQPKRQPGARNDFAPETLKWREGNDGNPAAQGAPQDEQPYRRSRKTAPKRHPAKH